MSEKPTLGDSMQHPIGSPERKDIASRALGLPSVQPGRCAMCGKTPQEFGGFPTEDDISEWKISQTCHRCWDELYGDEDE